MRRELVVGVDAGCSGGQDHPIDNACDPDLPPAMATRSTAIQLVAAAHIEPALVVTLVMVGLAVGVGLDRGASAVLVAAILTGQLSIGWSNDWIDARRGVDAGRTDKPLVNDGLGAGTVGAAALLSAGAAVVLSVLMGPVPGAIHVAAVALGWTYNLGAKATVWSAATYIGAFAALPVIVTTRASLGLPRWWAVLAAACFGAGVHFANALPDLERDRLHGIGGLPQRLGPAASLASAVGLLGVGAAAALLGPLSDGDLARGGAAAAWAGLAVVVALLGGVVVAARHGQTRLAFRGTMLAGLLVVGVLVAQGGRIAG